MWQPSLTRTVALNNQILLLGLVKTQRLLARRKPCTPSATTQLLPSVCRSLPPSLSSFHLLRSIEYHHVSSFRLVGVDTVVNEASTPITDPRNQCPGGLISWPGPQVLSLQGREGVTVVPGAWDEAVYERDVLGIGMTWLTQPKCFTQAQCTHGEVHHSRPRPTSTLM